MKALDLDKVVSTLPARPSRAPGEGLHGYLLRVVAENGLRKSGLVFDLCGLPAHGQVRFCPACLAQRGGLWRAEWERAGVYWCGEHLCWLVDACPHCGGRVRWRGMTARSCGCGYALSKFGRDPVSASVLRLQGANAADIALARWLGSLSRFGLGAKAWKRAQSEVPADVRDGITAGAEILAAWPSAFALVLDKVRVKPDALAPQAINAAFPGLVKAIGRLPSVEHRSLVLDALTGYVDRSQQSGQPLIGRNPRIRQASVSITKTAKRLGIAGNRLRAAIPDALPEQGVMGVTRGGRSRAALLPQDAAKVQAMIDDRISRTAAAHLLGVAAERVAALVSSGQLASWNHLVLRSSCEALARELCQAAKPASAPPPGPGTTHLAEAVRLWVPHHLTDSFFRAVVRGDIGVCCPTGGTDRPGELLVARAVVARWSALQKTDLGAALTIPQAARHLGLKQEVAYHLVRAGLIETEQMKVGRRMGQVVSAEGLHRFVQRNDPLSRAAARAGIDPRQGLAWAMQTNRRLVSGPSVDGGRQYFVQIATATELPEETQQLGTPGAATTARLQENPQ